MNFYDTLLFSFDSILSFCEQYGIAKSSAERFPIQGYIPGRRFEKYWSVRKDQIERWFQCISNWKSKNRKVSESAISFDGDLDVGKKEDKKKQKADGKYKSLFVDIKKLRDNDNWSPYGW